MDLGQEGCSPSRLHTKKGHGVVGNDSNPFVFPVSRLKPYFDSMDHNSMMTALARFGLSSRALAIIRLLYQDPSCYTSSTKGDQAHGEVGSGIRQGCPLSPYVFIMVLTIIL